ncbi:MAG: DUF222 domain-containing protein, partial [Actinomycetota bacterium]|nr:DUF222 domain-containing protein [Actinomycetota bacterium]
MFDIALSGPAVLAQASDGDLIDAITGCAAAAAAAEARKFAALAEFHRRRCADPQRARWACDDTDAAAAEIGAALTVSTGRAVGLMDTALILRDRLPKLNRRFLAGQVYERVVARIVWLCALVVDDAVWAALDEQFAEGATSWGVLSGEKLDTAITVWIELHDPDAVRRARLAQRDRDFRVGKRDDATGTTSVWGRLHTVDAAIAVQRINAMIAGVCDQDPRTLAQKRADAVGAVFAGVFELPCRCGTADCLAATRPDARAASVVVHVVADRGSLDAAADPAPQPDPAPRPALRPALIPALRGAILPAPLLAELIAGGAALRIVAGPDSVPANPGYRPLTALDEFVRCRDLTCRHPGCDRPAVYADLDHTQPWPAGSTHPANIKAYCRLHHLLKTFWDGWGEHQSPDGTLTLTTPTGHVYRTKPFSALL